jgi:hypothetical protein
MLGLNHPLPSIQSFNDYQKLVVEILDKTDMEYLGGKRIIKRSGWRKLALAFSVSFECRSEVIERDDAGNVTFARFCQVVPCLILLKKSSMLTDRSPQRAIMPDGRFCDGWGGCDNKEKRRVCTHTPHVMPPDLFLN